MFNVIEELARYGERFDDPIVHDTKVVVIELDGDGHVKGTRTEKSFRRIAWGHRSGQNPNPQPLCDLGHYILGISNKPSKAARARVCRAASHDLHSKLEALCPELPELGAVAAFLGRKLPKSLSDMSSEHKYIFEVDGVLLTGDKIRPVADRMRSMAKAAKRSASDMECAFSGEVGPLFQGTLPNMQGPWTKTMRKAFVTCNRPVIDHGYVKDNAITNPMSPRVARLHTMATGFMTERGQLVRMVNTVTLLWTREEHEIETLLPLVLTGKEPARVLERCRADPTPLYMVCSGSSNRMSVMHADVRQVAAVVRSVLEVYGTRMDEPWDLIWWIQMINKKSIKSETTLTMTEAASWMRSILSGEPLPRRIIDGLVEPLGGLPPTGDHVRIAECRFQ